MARADSIVEARKALMMSQEVLAQAAGVSVRTVARVEGGERASDETMKALCAVLRLEPAPCRDADAGGRPPDGLRVLCETGGSRDRQENLSDIEAFVRASLPEARVLAGTDMAAWRGANVDWGGEALAEGQIERKACFWASLSGTAVWTYPMLYALLSWTVLLPVFERRFPTADPHVLLLGVFAMAPVLLLSVPLAVALHVFALRERRLMRTAYAFDDGHVHEIVLTRGLVGMVTTPFSEIARGERRVTPHGVSYRLWARNGTRVAMPFLPDDPWLRDLLDRRCTGASVLHRRPAGEYERARRRLRGETELRRSKVSNPFYGIF